MDYILAIGFLLFMVYLIYNIKSERISDMISDRMKNEEEDKNNELEASLRRLSTLLNKGDNAYTHLGTNGGIASKYKTKQSTSESSMVEVPIELEEVINTTKLSNQYMSAVDKENYMRSPKFNRLRKKLVRLHGYKCAHCGATYNLNVHHITYARLGDELVSDLALLCGDEYNQSGAITGCHSMLHIIANELYTDGYSRSNIYSLDLLSNNKA